MLDDWCIMPALHAASCILTGARALQHCSIAHRYGIQVTMGDGDCKRPHATLVMNLDTMSTSPFYPSAFGAWR